MSRQDAIRRRRRELDKKVAEGLGVKLIAMTLLALAMMGGGWYYWNGQGGQDVTVQEQSQAVTHSDSSEPQASSTPNSAIPSAPSIPSPPTSTSSGISIEQGLSQNKELDVPFDAIEHAIAATVSLETPLGKASGFFVDKSGHVITSRHVVQIDVQRIEELLKKIEKGKESVRLEDESLAELKQQWQRMPAGASRNQLSRIIQDREEKVEEYRPQLREAEERLAKMQKSIQPADIKVTLANGEVYQANDLKISEKHDLALLQIVANQTPFLEGLDSSTLRQGDKVYTIGNPIGLSHTMTAGIFSGYRRINERQFLQTDAAINPGNSGGPLVDADGRALGVNTMIMQDTEGIGFAIPFAAVKEEFSWALY